MAQGNLGWLERAASKPALCLTASRQQTSAQTYREPPANQRSMRSLLLIVTGSSRKPEGDIT